MAGGERLAPNEVRNKIKRNELVQKAKRDKRQRKLKKRLERAKDEANDPLAKKKRLEANVPRTLDNTREFDPSFLTARPETETEAGTSTQPQAPSDAPHSVPAIDETALDIDTDPFASYFSSAASSPPKVLLTTSAAASKPTYAFCSELVDVIPGVEFVPRRRQKGKGSRPPEMGHIARWAAERGYTNMIVVNEDMKKPNAITVIHLPSGPCSYFKLSSVQLSKSISGHARSTSHYPELVLNNFVTRLGHTVGRMFQTLFPAMPEFQGRQVVTLHNQRDFLFFRRHRYAFRSTEKAALQEIGPRFTLKLRWMKKGLPAVIVRGRPAKGLEFAPSDDDESMENDNVEDEGGDKDKDDAMKTDENKDGNAAAAADNDNDEERGHEIGERDTADGAPPSSSSTQDAYIWMWKPELEATRKTFFL